MDLSQFRRIEFPPPDASAAEFVYVLCFCDGDREVPYYIGQTTRLWGRLDDYYWAEFAAPTDFRVGEAVRFLSTRGRVVVYYMSCKDSRTHEQQLIAEYGKQKLLNGLRVNGNVGAKELGERVREHLREILQLKD